MRHRLSRRPPATSVPHRGPVRKTDNGATGPCPTTGPAAVRTQPTFVSSGSAETIYRWDWACTTGRPSRGASSSRRHPDRAGVDHQGCRGHPCWTSAESWPAHLRQVRRDAPPHGPGPAPSPALCRMSTATPTSMSQAARRRAAAPGPDTESWEDAVRRSVEPDEFGVAPNR